MDAETSHGACRASALQCFNSGPTIRHCVFSNNRNHQFGDGACTTATGGAVYCVDSVSCTLPTLHLDRDRRLLLTRTALDSYSTQTGSRSTSHSISAEWSPITPLSR